MDSIGGIMSWQEIESIEKNIYEMALKLEKLRKAAKPVEIKNYKFQNSSGETSLLKLFKDNTKLLVIHNMGQACRWCTSWADAINGVLPHLESEFSVVLVSKDSPEIQRNFALSRKWNFEMASHAGSEYIIEQSTKKGEKNMPGVVFYERQGDKIFRKNSSIFGPGDFYNPLFHLVTLGGIGFEEFTPQYSYWKYPNKLDDSGENYEESEAGE